VKVFISYSTADKIIAGQIKESIENHGIECFIAHDDIVPGSEWEKEIQANLEATEYFMPLHTSNLVSSFWCQQECGIAVAHNKTIIPLIPDVDGVDPVGFCKRYQGIKIKTHNIPNSVKYLLITKGLILDDNSEEIEKRMMLFEASSSWADAARSTRSLFELENSFGKADILRIVHTVLSNGEILYSFDAQPHLKRFFMKHAGIISKDHLQKFLEATK
jgi:hypothetical protein